MKITKYLMYTGTLLLGLSSCRKENQKEEERRIIDEQGPLVTDAPDHGEPIQNQYILTYKNGSTSGEETYNVTESESSQRESEIQEFTHRLLDKHKISPENIIKRFHSGVSGFTAILNQEQVKNLQKDSDIENIEPDRIVHLSNDIFTTTSISTQATPWGIKKTGCANGTGKTCWIIDTGIDFTHSDLNVDVARSKSFLTTDISASDMNGHGTHVAGIVGAKDNNFGVVGVASNASLVSLRVLDATGSGHLSDIIAAVNWVGSHARPGDVVNMSVGGANSATLDYVVRTVSMKGIYFAIAAGNNAQNATKNSPADVNSPYVFTVSAMDVNDKFASFSNFGNPPIDWCAPGVGILSTYKGNKYATMSGTSMAAPHVAGLLLLNGRNLNSSGFVKDDPDGQPDKMAHR